MVQENYFTSFWGFGFAVGKGKVCFAPQINTFPTHCDNIYVTILASQTFSYIPLLVMGVRSDNLECPSLCAFQNLLYKNLYIYVASFLGNFNLGGDKKKGILGPE